MFFPTRACLALVCAALLAGGCASRAPYPGNTGNVTRPGAWAGQPAAGEGSQIDPGPAPVDPATLPGYENMGKPGYHTVRPGETVRRIAADYGQNWRDVISWNPQLANADVIEVGQVLRVAPPGRVAAPATPPAHQAGGVQVTPVQPGTAGGAEGASPTAPAPTVATQITPGASATPATPPATAADSAETTGLGSSSISFAWPAKGQVVSGSANEKGKALFIAGKAGDPVLAAADGKVVYAGAGLRGYGNLLIVQHTDSVISAYAHNRALLVKEKQAVKKGQRIAEMGDSHASRVMLRFEIRNNGKLVDPLRYLPAR